MEPERDDSFVAKGVVRLAGELTIAFVAKPSPARGPSGRSLSGNAIVAQVVRFAGRTLLISAGRDRRNRRHHCPQRSRLYLCTRWGTERPSGASGFS
jgi:hypothetical protein